MVVFFSSSSSYTLFLCYRCQAVRSRFLLPILIHHQVTYTYLLAIVKPLLQHSTTSTISCLLLQPLSASCITLVSLFCPHIKPKLIACYHYHHIRLSILFGHFDVTFFIVLLNWPRKSNSKIHAIAELS